MVVALNRLIKLQVNRSEHQLIAKFVIVGVLNTIVGYGSFFILSYFINYIFALVISHFIGVTHSYIWNRYWTFKSSNDKLKEFVRFNMVYLVALAADIILLYVLVSKMGLDPRLCQLAILIVITIISYTGHRLWSFRQAENL
jgi:putative flippase GtrA